MILSGSGDALASPTFRRLLRRIHGHTFPNLKDVALHTNGLKWTKQAWDSMPGVQPLMGGAVISIDAACAETYQENRRGGNYGTLLENLEFIRTLGLTISAAFVVQENKFREMLDFVSLHRDHFGFSVTFRQLANWRFREGEFLSRAVHLPSHPCHQELVELLTRPEFHQPRVWLGGLG